VPVVLLGRSLDFSIDTVTNDNASAGRQATNYLLDLGHRRIGSITGPLHLSTSRGRLHGMQEAMAARNLSPLPDHIRSGEFREESAYSVARDMLVRPDRPSALYVANGVMAIGVMSHCRLGITLPPAYFHSLHGHHFRHGRYQSTSHTHRASGDRYDK
jgi:LacI family transcriptional regulator